MKKIVLLFVLMFAFVAALLAQNIRIAYIDSDRIMRETNDTREAQRLFSLDRENWDQQIDEISADIQRIEREYESRRMTLSESGRKESEERIAARIRERQQLIERIYGETGIASSRNAELLAPIMERLRVVIDRIAVDENYSIIFDVSTSGIVWAVERMDITQQVIHEMNREGR